VVFDNSFSCNLWVSVSLLCKLLNKKRSSHRHRDRTKNHRDESSDRPLAEGKFNLRNRRNLRMNVLPLACLTKTFAVASFKFRNSFFQI